MIPTTPPIINRTTAHCGTFSRRPRPRSPSRTLSLCVYVGRCLLVGHRLSDRTDARPHRCVELSCSSFLRMFTLLSLLLPPPPVNSPPLMTPHPVYTCQRHVSRLHNSSLYMTPSARLTSAPHRIVLSSSPTTQSHIRTSHC